jgi:hypothetical protein
VRQRRQGRRRRLKRWLRHRGGRAAGEEEGGARGEGASARGKGEGEHGDVDSGGMERERAWEEPESVVVCPAIWGRGDDPVAGRALGEGEVYPPEWVRVANGFVDVESGP